jgi:hypothetical protein
MFFLLFLLDDRRDPDPDSDPYLVLTDPDPGGPKTYGSYGFESGSATLVVASLFILVPKKYFTL